MQKKQNLAFFFLLVSAFVALTSTATAQEIADGKQSAKTKTEIDILQAYKEISALPMNANMHERRAVFLKLSAVEKSRAFKFHLAMQLVKRPNLTPEQKNIILEAISMITSESYGDNAEKRSVAQQQAATPMQKASVFFPKREIFEIFASLGGDQIDVRLLERYQQVTASAYISERKSAFIKFTAQEASDIMKIHLVSQMVKRPLSKEQLSFIGEIISLVSPELYSATKKASDAARNDEILKPFKERVANFFSKQETFEIFSSLGGVCGKSNNDTPSLANIDDPAKEGGCSCNQADSDYCSWFGPPGTRCRWSPCDRSDWGCGDFLSYPCNGICGT
jgi:hypothetical protein